MRRHARKAKRYPWAAGFAIGLAWVTYMGAAVAYLMSLGMGGPH